MLESIFIAFLFISIIIQIIAIYEKSIIYSMLSVILYIFLMANTLNIEVPYVSNVYNMSSSMVDQFTGTYASSDLGLNAILIAFIMINIVWSIYQYTSTFKHRI